eukprot:7620997-Heterocapsa_arctica.AAC.1
MEEPVTMLVNAVNAVVENPITLYEYCCGQDSLLASWFRGHGHQAIRLTLPIDDMSHWSSVRHLLDELRER